MFIDSHAHLQWSNFKNDLPDVISRATQNGVKYIVNVGFDLKGSKEAVQLSDKFQNLYGAVGIHPHVAKNFSSHVLDELRLLSENRKVVAIGEVGLDYYRNLSSKEAPRKAFLAQLELSSELDLLPKI